MDGTITFVKLDKRGKVSGLMSSQNLNDCIDYGRNKVDNH